MQPQTKETLSAAGININDGLERFMGNEALLTRFLKRFLEDSNYRTLLHAVSAGDQKQAMAASHTLKGICGNLSMTALFDLLTQQVQLLRAGDWASACSLMPQISASYQMAVEAIKNI
ncbi:MAG TPA: Hpt domain-containing protein [Candidatus Gallacutalibacter stercoravium]|nr:Hpt domain-containing protein [Candidatus Gallacutalibacter stercoravium]